MIATLLLLACSSSTPDATPADPASARRPIRIGWQTTWATQGQLAVVLQKTDILDTLGYDATWVGFTYGGPLNEGALAGEVDVIFTADQPAISLMNKGPDWNIIGRLMYNRVGTFVPPDAPAKGPGDLKGKTIAVPFGAAAHRETLAALEGAGLNPKEDANVINLGIQELVNVIGGGARDGAWGAVHAGGAWDPAYADLEHAGKVRTVASGVVTSVVVMSDKYAAANAGADADFMKAMHRAYGYYKAHRAEVDGWFLEAAGLDFDPEVLALAASVEPNLEGEIRVSLSEEDLGNLQKAADFMKTAKLLKEPFAVAPRVKGEAAASAGEGTPEVKVLR
jgi:sulfonate transport system substrate-binding protein